MRDATSRMMRSQTVASLAGMQPTRASFQARQQQQQQQQRSQNAAHDDCSCIYRPRPSSCGDKRSVIQAGSPHCGSETAIASTIRSFA